MVKNKFNLRKGQQVKITYGGFGFKDTGKIGTFVSYKASSYYIYVEGSKNNNYNCKDIHGNNVTWCLAAKDFKIIGQLLFPFMYEEEKL